MSDEPLYKPGDRVKRSGGSYVFPGVVLGSVLTTLGRRLYVVEHRTERGLTHLFREGDLTPDEEATA